MDLTEQLADIFTSQLEGRVVQTAGTTVAVADFPAPLGSTVAIDRHAGPPIEAEVIGFRDALTLACPLADTAGIRHGSRVRLLRTSRRLLVGPQLLGRVIDARGNVIDGKPTPALVRQTRLDRSPPVAVERPRIVEPLSTGIRALDGLLTCGKGQRMGIFSGSGVGKSVILGMMARYTTADVNVIGLIGERGREVNEFIDQDLGPKGLARSVVVVATSDEPAPLRVMAAFTATAIAEFFRDQGNDVLLVMDSLTRFALAQREIGLAAGEPPTTRGFPPSVFSLLPKLLERTGRSRQGSITGFYSVLVEGDDANEPVADTVRGLLDGHTWLSRKLAGQGHYPAIDILHSISRLMPSVVERPHLDAATLIRGLLAAYGEHEDLISIGAYRRGGNPTVDLAIDLRDQINLYLRQRVEEPSSVTAAGEELAKLVAIAAQRSVDPGAAKQIEPVGK